MAGFDSNIVTGNEDAGNDLVAALEDLKLEKETRTQLSEQLSNTSTELTNLRQRNASLEAQLQEAKDHSAHLTQQMKGAELEQAKSAQNSTKLKTALKEIYHWRCNWIQNMVIGAALEGYSELWIDLRDGGDPYYIRSHKQNGDAVFKGRLHDTIKNSPNLSHWDSGVLKKALVETGGKPMWTLPDNDDFGSRKSQRALEMLAYQDPKS